MLIRNLLRHPDYRSWLIGLALVLTIGGWSALAQEPLPPNLQELDNALRAKGGLPSREEAAELTKALQERAKTLKRMTDKLDSLSDMAQALLLSNWGDDDRPEVTVQARAFAVDRETRVALLERFLRGVKDEIRASEQAHDPPLRAAVATLVGEFAVSARSGNLGVRHGNSLLMVWLGDFTVVLAGVAEKGPSPEGRAASASALAKIQADPFKEKPPANKEDFDLSAPRVPTTVPALRTLLKDPDPRVRRAGASALRDLLRGTPAADRGGSVSAPVVEPSGQNLLDFGPQVARAAGAALDNSERDPDVRRLCAEALLEVATLIDPRLRLTGALSTREQQPLRPVVEALWDQTKAVAQATRDRDNDVRATAIRALEEMGNVRYHWSHPSHRLETAPDLGKPPTGSRPLRSEITPEEARDLSLVVAVMQAPPTGKPANTPFPPPLASAIKPLVDVLKSSDNVRNRLGAIDALETITARDLENPNVPTLASDLGKGPTAEAARALTEALADPNRFIRWAAARVLGKMAPLDDAEDGQRVQRNAVSGLARLMMDPDPDVRLRSAVALELFGSAAESALPALAAASTHGDLEARLAATHALETIRANAAGSETIHTNAAPAVPALAISLADPNVRLRRAAASALAAYGAQTRRRQPALNRALFDPDPEVRREASDALLKIGARR